MSGFPVPPRPPPGTHGSASWDFSTFLQLTADQYSVGQGAGGAAILLNRDTLFAPPPSQEGVGGTKPKLTVKTNDPKLDDPSFAGIGLWSMQFATTILHIVVGSLKPAPDTLSGLSSDESLSTTLAYREEAFKQVLEEEGITSPYSWGTEGPQGPGVGIANEGNVSATVDVNDTSVNAAFFAWMESMSQATSTEIPPLSSKTQALLTDVRSTNVSVVQQALVRMANLSSLSLSHAQKTLFLAKFDTLAKAIATSNAAGGTFALNLTIPGFMLPVMMETLDMSTDTGMSIDDKNQLSVALLNICTTLAKANFEESIATKTPSKEYKSLASKNPQQVSTLLFTIASTMALPPGVSGEDMVGAVTAIASHLCALNTVDQQTLESIDRAGLTALFTRGLKAAEAAGAITADVESKLIVTLVPLLVDQTVAINRTKLIGDLNSQDKTAIAKSLTFLTEVNTDPRLNAPTRRVAMSYIQALIVALGYMANLRGLMLEMETTFTQELANAKIASIADQLKTAETVYINELNKVTTTYKSTIEQMEKQDRLAWQMPFISLGIAILMLLLSIAAVVTSVLTAGAAVPAWVATITSIGAGIAGAVGVVCSAVAVAVTLADAVCQWTVGQSMWAMLCESMGVTSPLAQAAINAAFQILIQIVCIAATCGAFAAYSAVKLTGLFTEMTEVVGTEAFEGEAARLAAIDISETAAETVTETAASTASEALTTTLKAAEREIEQQTERQVVEGAAKEGTKLGIQGLPPKPIAPPPIPAGVEGATRLGAIGTERAAAEAGAAAAAERAGGAATEAGAAAAAERAGGAATAAGEVAAAERAGGESAAAGGAATAEKAAEETSATVEKVGEEAIEGVVGVGTGAAGEATAEAGAETGAGLIGKAVPTAVEKSLQRVITETLAQQVIMAFFSSGLPGQLLEKAGEALFGNDPKKSSIFSAVMTAILMIASLVVCGVLGKGSVSPGALKSLEKGAAKATEEALVAAGEEIPMMAGGVVQKIAKMTMSEMMQAVKRFLNEAIKWIKTQAQDFLKSLKIWLASPFTRSAAAEAKVAGKTADEEAKATAEAAFEEVMESWEAGGTKAEAIEGLEGMGATTANSLRVSVRNALINCLNAILKGLKNLMLNSRDEILGIVGTSVETGERIGNIIKAITDLLRAAIFAMQITTGVQQYKADQLQKYYHTLLAQLAEECAIVEAMMAFFTNITGIDQSATIKKINDATGESFKNWTKLVDLVSSFIKDASARMRELGNKARM